MQAAASHQDMGSSREEVAMVAPVDRVEDMVVVEGNHIPPNMEEVLTTSPLVTIHLLPRAMDREEVSANAQ